MDEDPFKNKQEKSDITIEIAKPEDWQAYRDIRLLAITGQDANLFGPKQIEADKGKDEQGWKEELLMSDRFVVLAREGSEVFGVCLVKDKGKGTWDIGSGYTKEKSRGKVFARKALTKILDEIKNRAGTRALIVTKVENKDVISFAEKLGFKNYATEEGWYMMELNIVDKNNS